MFSSSLLPRLRSIPACAPHSRSCGSSGNAHVQLPSARRCMGLLRIRGASRVERAACPYYARRGGVSRSGHTHSGSGLAGVYVGGGADIHGELRPPDIGGAPRSRRAFVCGSMVCVPRASSPRRASTSRQGKRRMCNHLFVLALRACSEDEQPLRHNTFVRPYGGARVAFRGRVPRGARARIAAASAVAASHMQTPALHGDVGLPAGEGMRHMERAGLRPL